LDVAEPATSITQVAFVSPKTYGAETTGDHIRTAILSPGFPAQAVI